MKTQNKVRLRVRWQRGEDGVDWYAVAMDRGGRVLDRSPNGTEAEAKAYLKTYRQFGAWTRS